MAANITREEERALVLQLRLGGRAADIAGAKLLRAYERYVWRVIAPFARRIGQEHREDLVQEANLGLLMAAKRFDLDRGLRLLTFAVHWILARVRVYALSFGTHTGPVRFATSRDERKLLYGYAQASHKLRREGKEVNRETVCKALGLDPSRHTAAYAFVSQTMPIISLDGVTPNGDTYAEVLGLSAATPQPDLDEELDRQKTRQTVRAAINAAGLDRRERRIIEQRTKGATLEVLAEALCLSRERIRQIEARAYDKLRAQLS